MSKTITKVEPRFGGHVKLEFDDGTSKMLDRSLPESKTIKPGDTWPLSDGKPSAADLDAVAEEEKAKDATASAS